MRTGNLKFSMLPRIFAELLVADPATPLTGNYMNQKQKSTDVPLFKGVERCLITYLPIRLQI
jgi:hypothetical protein